MLLRSISGPSRLLANRSTEERAPRRGAEGVGSKKCDFVGRKQVCGKLLKAPPGPLDFDGGSIGPTPQLHLQNFAPRRRESKPIITTASLNIDGQQLARVIASKIAEMSENSSVSMATSQHPKGTPTTRPYLRPESRLEHGVG